MDRNKSPAGLALAALVFMVYRIACIAEGPFTTRIYAEADSRRKKE